MKALILRADAATAVETAHLLAQKGFQTLCVASRDIAHAMIRADVIDLMVMDERVGGQLTHTLALSAERRNPYVSTIILTDEGADTTDDLYDLLPSLYALVGTGVTARMLGQLVLAAVANLDEVTQRVQQYRADDLDDVLFDDPAVPLADASVDDDVPQTRVPDRIWPVPDVHHFPATQAMRVPVTA
jgi:hypothetical protein